MTDVKRRAVGVAIAMAIATGLIGVSAQQPGQDALKAEVSAAWEDYLKLFAAGRADVIGERVYLAPSFNLTANRPWNDVAACAGGIPRGPQR